MKSQEKVPKTTENSCYWVLLMVPVTGLEPVRHRWRWILSPLRLPFHHTGNCIFKFPLQNRSSENGGQNRRAIQKTLHIHFQKVLVFQGKSHTPEDLANQILSPPRLPIPTHRQAPLQYSTDSGKMQEKVFPRPERHMSVSFRAKGSADALFAVEFLDKIYVGAKISLGALFGSVAGAAEQRRKHNAACQCRAGGC